ncbi:short chain dehydrogenase/reductase [Mytilinidion resinicola]|uniref:Short chain dehydrogenase/reductase n=1 Tax=Mytilinidion resinicola TaxID=574789 RepID=A0A6A6YH83_9PEZI|nr:short chain dehydrogenase/reductase [Mytilinidion resinicola]KAF2808120.1 short chain dehydrogenase/reductase [Mytilinidion resinicola]
MAPTTVLITGANSGVGYATTQVLASASEKFHIILACRSLENAEKAKSEIEAAGIKGTLSTVQLDVTNSESVKQAAELVGTKFGTLDVLINNAGMGSQNPDVKTRFQETLEVNVIGPAVVAEAFRPLLLKAEKPYSIYVTSGLGSLAAASASGSDFPGADCYCTSKAALNMLMMREWVAFKSKGLKSFAMCPGFVISNLRGKSEEARNGGRFGQAEDPKTSGELVLSIIEGERDSDAGGFVQKDGVWPW